MPISVVVGGQFGSEGKGKVAHFLARERQARIAVRVGGPNSGHTVVNDHGDAVIFRHLPTACLLPAVTSVVPAGSYLDIPTLLSEMRFIGKNAARLAIDPNAWVITDEDVRAETMARLADTIGSTGTGTGAAIIRRISRLGNGNFAKDVTELRPFVRDTTELLSEALQGGQRIVVEGTQGFGLSLLHSNFYPYCTSRDTSAATFVAEAGLSPIDVDEILLVIRAFPIRVAGPSGPLKREIDWETITEESGSLRPIVEYTSVTKRVRRVGRFDGEIVKNAIARNRPTCIVLNHLDHIDANCAIGNAITQRVWAYIDQVEQEIDAEILLLGCGPEQLSWRDVHSRRTGVR